MVAHGALGNIWLLQILVDGCPCFQMAPWLHMVKYKFTCFCMDAYWINMIIQGFKLLLRVYNFKYDCLCLIWLKFNVVVYGYTLFHIKPYGSKSMNVVSYIYIYIYFRISNIIITTADHKIDNWITWTTRKSGSSFYSFCYILLSVFLISLSVFLNNY